MKWYNLSHIHEAPHEGQVLAYTRSCVIFHSFSGLEELKLELENSELLELHIFDQEKEYRSIASRSRRAQGGVFEAIADFTEKGEDVYKEEVLLEAPDNGKKLIVLNHLQFNKDSGMAYIDNYRLHMKENEYV